jgi:ABC-type Fe3+-hydroxamate transport system, periplasmic component
MYGTRLLPYLQDQIGDLPAISTSSINLELILQEKPELILLAYPAYAQEGRYEQFAKIAPTYVFSGEDGWKDTLKKVADVIGRPEQAEAWLNEYEDKTAKARESLKQAIGDETVMFIRFTRAERIQIYGGPSNFSADVLYGDLGLQPSKLIKEFAWGEDNSAPLISAEMIPDFDADHIFITYDKPGEDDAKEFQNHPLWKNVPAVQKGNLHEVEMFHWMNDGPIANSTKVDDVLKALLK